MTVLAASLALTITIGYFAATAYLLLRDDIIAATIVRQRHLQQAYENRIAELRTRLDRVTSRQLLDQELIQRKVNELAERQNELGTRYLRLDQVLGGTTHTDARHELPTPSPRPAALADPDDRLRLDAITTGSAYSSTDAPDIPWPDRNLAYQSEADRADLLFIAINRSLQNIETEQKNRVKAATEKAYQAAELLTDALNSTGVALPDGSGDDHTGGPLIFFHQNALFQERIRELDEVLDRLDVLRRAAKRTPIFHPVPDAVVTSRFGMRRDPILRRPAYHGGVDFRVTRGAPVHAGGDGTVVRAGWNGSYGRMVEIDHGDGITTRYAHLSQVLVKAGEPVRAGEIVGQAGSSGRSTGPHLHYEVRRGDTAVDPLKFIKAGRRIAEYL